MTIEALLTRVAVALEANTEAMNTMISGAAGKPASGAAATKPAATKPAATKPATKAATKTGEHTGESVKERVTAFLKTGTKDEREVRKDQVKSIIDHFGVDRFTAIDPEQFEEAMGYLDAYEAGEDPFGGDGDEDGGEEAMV